MVSAKQQKILEYLEASPEEAAKLLLALDARNVRPHSGQVQVLESQARFRVMNCGRRWGKTVIAAKIMVQKSRTPNQMLWWVAPTYKIVKRGYEQILAQLSPDALSKDPPPASNFDAGRAVVLYFKNGTRMEFYSAERPESMLGAAVDFCIMDEAALMTSRIFNQHIQPTLMDHQGGALMISTPRGRNWFYDSWLKGQDPEQPLWESWTFTTQDNPTLPEGEADRMAADMPRVEADQEIYAKWLAAGSSVFILEDHAIERLAIYDNGLVDGRERVKGAVFLGIDLARTNDYTVLYGTQEIDRRNVYFERIGHVAWSEQLRRIKRAVRTLMHAGAEYVHLMVDEGNAGSVIVEALEEQGFSVSGINFTTHKSNMVRKLANDLERGQAFVLDEHLREFENYITSVTPKGAISYSAPEGQHDDVVSAKMLSHWGCVNEGAGNVQLLDASDPSVPLPPEHNPWDEDEDDFTDEDFSWLIEETAEIMGVPSMAPGDFLRGGVASRGGATQALTPEQQFAAQALEPHTADFLLG